MSRKSAVRSLYQQARKEALFRTHDAYLGDIDYLSVWDGDSYGCWVKDPPDSGNWRQLFYYGA